MWTVLVVGADHQYHGHEKELVSVAVDFLATVLRPPGRRSCELRWAEPGKTEYRPFPSFSGLSAPGEGRRSGPTQHSKGVGERHRGPALETANDVNSVIDPPGPVADTSTISV